MPDEEFDVAISFLSADCPTAEQVADRLAPLNVFIFPRNQEEVAGTDGMDTFRHAFRNNSKIQVVLFREAWGQTPWTRVESTAIQERCLAEGWRGLFFIALEAANRPNWVPDTHIHFDLAQYSLDQLVGAIKARAQELGVQLRRETPIERARRAQERAAFEIETRRLFRGHDGVNLAREEVVRVCDILEPAINEAAAELELEIRVVRTTPHGISWTTPNSGLMSSFSSSVNMLSDDAGFNVSLFKHGLVLPGENLRYVNPNMPRRHCNDRYRVRRTMGLGMCWEIHDGSVLSSANLANKILDDFWSVYEDAVANPPDIGW